MKTFWGFLFVTIVTHAGEPGAARDLSRQATELYNHARYAEAEPLFRRALEAWDKLGAEVGIDRAIDMRNLGALLRARGRYAEAEPLLTKAASLLEAGGAPGMDIGPELRRMPAAKPNQGFVGAPSRNGARFC